LGQRVTCSGCGSSCGSWLVESEGERVAAASEAEVLPGRRLRETMRYTAGAAWRPST
jgi:hypothetical protein